MGDDSIVITVDFKNAYNMRKRIDMWNALLKHRSQNSGSCADLSRLIRYFHWAYSVASPLVLPAMTNDRRSNHLITLQSCEGVRQGANESSLLFSLSMQEIYEQALKGLPVESVQATAIQDDFTIVGKPELALQVFKRLQELAKDHGMEVQPEKCTVLPPAVNHWSQSVAVTIDELGELGVKQTGLLPLLGATIGYDEDIDHDSALVKEWAENVALVENERFVQLLTHRDMPVQIAFRLLVQSGLPRLAYLCRVMSPSVLSVTTHKFDQLLLQTACKLFDLKINVLSRNQKWDRVRGQMQLKMRNGGLGITPYVDISPSAYLSSLASATPAILTLFDEIGQENDSVKMTKEKYETLYQKIRQSILSVADPPSSLLPSSKQQFDNNFASSINNTHRLHPSPAVYKSTEAVAHLQSKLSAAIEKKRAQRFEESLNNAVDKARLLSSSQPSASVWLSTVPEENALRLTNEQFIAAIRHRLSVASLTVSKCCQCDPTTVINDSQHTHVCLLLKKKETNSRHELIVSTLMDLCRLAGVSTQISFPLIRDRDTRDIIPDFYAFTAEKSFMIDVRVTYPPSDTYIRHSKETPLAAAEAGEKDKVRKYNSLARKNGMIFVPFVLESFGAIGKMAKRFTSIFSESSSIDEGKQFFAYCIRRLSIALQRGNASMQVQGMRKLLVSSNGINVDRRRHLPDILVPPLPSLAENFVNQVLSNEEEKNEAIASELELAEELAINIMSSVNNNNNSLVVDPPAIIGAPPPVEVPDPLPFVLPPPLPLSSSPPLPDNSINIIIPRPIVPLPPIASSLLL